MSAATGILRFALAASLACLTAGAATAQIKINEIRIDQPGTDTDEYFELKGTPGASLNGLTYLVIGDVSGAPTCGGIDAAIPLDGYSIQADGLFAAVDGDPGPTLTGYDAVIAGPNGINFENSDNVTHMLVQGFTGTVGDDLDTNDDGVLDVTPWTAILDCVGLSKGTTPDCTTEEYLYCATVVGPDGTFVPGHVYRCVGTDAWVIGLFSPIGTSDTPGAPNFSCSGLPPDVTGERRDPCVPLVNQAVTVEVDVLYGASADLHYTVNGGVETVLAMAEISTSGDTKTFGATIPGQLNKARVEYFVEAFNASLASTQGNDQGYFAGVASVSDLRVNDANGANLYRFYGVRLRGSVTVPYGLFSTTDTDYYLQDASGGINVFKFGTHEVQPGLGDDITVVGALDQYSGKLEISDVGPCDSLVVTINADGLPPLAPQLITTCELNEDVEGLLVRMENVEILTAAFEFPVGNSNWNVTNCSPDTVTLRIDQDTDIDGTFMNSRQVHVVGIAGQFDFTSPFDDFYQIQPRGLTDITYLAPSGVPIGDAAGRLWLGPAAPNPFGQSAQIRYRIPAGVGEVAVKLTIVDLQGRTIATLVDALQTPGEHVVTLDRLALRGVRSSVLFARLAAGGKVTATRMVFMR